MTDASETTTQPSAGVTIDAAKVVHDAERDARHGLSHLEDEFLAEWDKLFTGMHASARQLLAWLASKL